MYYSNKLNKDTDNKFIKKDELQSVKNVLDKLKNGYLERNIETSSSFADEIYWNSDDAFIIGTAMEEVCIGGEQIKELFENDFKYWGKVKLDTLNTNITVNDDKAWVSTFGTVSYTFEDTESRYDSYIEYIKGVALNQSLNDKQKTTFINWVLALTYHKRDGEKRYYKWPLQVSGFLLKRDEKWKFTHLHFALKAPIFPDESINHHADHQKNYEIRNKIASDYQDKADLKNITQLIQTIKNELIGKSIINLDVIERYFDVAQGGYILLPDDQGLYESKAIKNFFETLAHYELDIKQDKFMACEYGNVIYLSGVGLISKNFSENEIFAKTIRDILQIVDTSGNSKDKLFNCHKMVSYGIKQEAQGDKDTWPIRFTGVLLKQGQKIMIHQLHLSYPNYWIFEGKY
ncbi:MAG: nuclear transport factor 2 family protein [Turicibacter sp.]